MINVGFSAEDITPITPKVLGGYAARNKLSCGVHDNLYVKVCSITEDNNENSRTIFVSCDVLAVMQEQFFTVKKYCRQIFGVENVILAATHTHSAPETRLRYDLDKVNSVWIDRVISTVLSAVGKAIESEVPMTVKSVHFPVYDVTKSRRADDSDSDENAGALCFYDGGDVLKGIILNFACHCTVLDASNYLVSADFPGYIYDLAEKHFPDAVTLFTNGAAGNLNIGYSADASALGIDMGDIRSFNTAKEKATLIFNALLKELPNAKLLTANLKYIRLPLNLPTKENLPSSEELCKSIEQKEQQLLHTLCEKEQAQLKTLIIYETCILNNLIEYNISKGGEEIHTEMTVLAVDNVCLITFPGEMFSIIGKSIKNEFKKHNLNALIVGYANGYFGYMPTKKRPCDRRLRV